MPLGVKVSEIDASLYSNSSYASPCLAVIGTATKGPIGVPTLCISQKELKNKFGPQNPNCMGLYSANYFLAEANRCYYIRVAKDALAAYTNIGGTTSDGSAVENVLTLEAISAGEFYNGYKVTISNSVDGSFDITIKDNSNITIANAKGANLDPTSDKYLGKLIGYSGCVKIKEGSIIEGDYILENKEYTLSSGTNGITGLSSSDYIKALDSLMPDTIDAELLVIPGVHDSEVILKAINVCELRGDTLYIVDSPAGMTYEEVINWHNGVGGDATHVEFNSSFGALYWSWQYIYDEVTSQEVLVPPSVVVPAVYARNDDMSHEWFAPAGLTRGLIKNVLRSETSPDTDMQDLLYTDPNNVNPIITHPTLGLAVFGQKTLWRQPTSLNRVNVRRLVTYIKRLVKDIAKYLVFEPNDTSTWNSFFDLVDPRLRSIKANRGLYEYKIIKGEDIVTTDDIDNYRMPAQILIKPTKAAEFIPIDIVITSTGTNYNEYNNPVAEQN